ncbi:hypothetical protein F1559_003889 [Cyanidiococcus yangmingshanensis]|uniref:Uncharacterized protein n=1 Tax=Cyanidiococcus yangmingshanensis TaxID=2690220 RepID=A0A7J7IFD2_9RHOD|nr:hypothetical protein F1559_003889 [Cyanidiococcus yangmingshanensis]
METRSRFRSIPSLCTRVWETVLDTDVGTHAGPLEGLCRLVLEVAMEALANQWSGFIDDDDGRVPGTEPVWSSACALVTVPVRTGRCISMEILARECDALMEMGITGDERADEWPPRGRCCKTSNEPWRCATIGAAGE